jgi:hypothetical protein
VAEHVVMDLIETVFKSPGLDWTTVTLLIPRLTSNVW